MATKWQEFISDLKATLKQINGVSPYVVNIQQRVFEWRVEPLIRTEIPSLAIMDGGIELTNFTFNNCQETLTTIIYVYARTVEELRNLCQDVLTAIKSYFEGTSKAWDLEMDRIEVGVLKHETMIVEASMTFIFRILTEPWKL